MKTIFDFVKYKKQQKKISMITCYDYSFAQLIESTDIDCVLVGDSSSMLMHGASNTTQSTLSQMDTHTRAVAKGLSKFLISDLPFMSYRKSLSETMNAVEQLMRAGAQAVKLEGGEENAETIRYIVQSGIPVMGHIGLTPQHIHGLGGFKVQGKTQASSDLLLKQAQALEAVGCFAIVIECVPAAVAQRITEALNIPTIGIGAGPETDGQVLVLQDLLGFQTAFKPKFVKCYLNGAMLIQDAINGYVSEVQAHEFPAPEHFYEGNL